MQVHAAARICLARGRVSPRLANYVWTASLATATSSQQPLPATAFLEATAAFCCDFVEEIRLHAGDLYIAKLYSSDVVRNLRRTMLKGLF